MLCRVGKENDQAWAKEKPTETVQDAKTKKKDRPGSCHDGPLRGDPSVRSWVRWLACPFRQGSSWRRVSTAQERRQFLRTLADEAEVALRQRDGVKKPASIELKSPVSAPEQPVLDIYLLYRTGPRHAIAHTIAPFSRYQTRRQTAIAIMGD